MSGLRASKLPILVSSRLMCAGESPELGGHRLLSHVIAHVLSLIHHTWLFLLPRILACCRLLSLGIMEVSAALLLPTRILCTNEPDRQPDFA
jgi:hypothetical protein